MAYKAIAHKKGDAVAVAVADLSPGDRIMARILDGSQPVTVTVCDPIPLGHKVALIEMRAGQDVTEYGERIGRTTQPIPAGAHVHVHNMKSVRWSA
jgi:(2R)-sulfolactate sulfo-lyase subunit alpha